jgi:hypothetical protein
MAAITNLTTLWDFDIAGIIVLESSGHFYTHQTDGCACHHPIAQGSLIPISHGDSGIMRAFDECCGIRNTFGKKLSPLNKSKIIQPLNKHCKNIHIPFTVDYSMWDKSEEAWVYGHVNLNKLNDLLKRCPSDLRSKLYKKPISSGIVQSILIWENSD